jgi:hypothetical protein
VWFGCAPQPRIAWIAVGVLQYVFVTLGEDDLLDELVRITNAAVRSWVAEMRAAGGLFEDGSEAAVDRLDVLLGGGSKDSYNVVLLDTRETE